MKLIFCQKCHDVIKLRSFRDGKPDRRFCDCGRSGGYYEEDGDKVVVWGYARLIGLRNGFFMKDIERIQESIGPDFVFWYPEDNGKVTRREL
jgi:hypothetical protein